MSALCFLLPLVEKLSHLHASKPVALVLGPVRELCIQTETVAKQLMQGEGDCQMNQLVPPFPCSLCVLSTLLRHPSGTVGWRFVSLMNICTSYICMYASCTCTLASFSPHVPCANQCLNILFPLVVSQAAYKLLTVVHHLITTSCCVVSCLGLPNLRTALLVGGLPLANQLHRLKQQVQVRSPVCFGRVVL